MKRMNGKVPFPHRRERADDGAPHCDLVRQRPGPSLGKLWAKEGQGVALRARDLASVPMDCLLHKAGAGALSRVPAPAKPVHEILQLHSTEAFPQLFSVSVDTAEFTLVPKRGLG